MKPIVNQNIIHFIDLKKKQELLQYNIKIQSEGKKTIK